MVLGRLLQGGPLDFYGFREQSCPYGVCLSWFRSDLVFCVSFTIYFSGIS
jgi:hypothetical protein